MYVTFECSLNVLKQVGSTVVKFKYVRQASNWNISEKKTLYEWCINNIIVLMFW